MCRVVLGDHFLMGSGKGHGDEFGLGGGWGDLNAANCSILQQFGNIGGRNSIEMFSGMFSAPDLCQPAPSMMTTPCALVAIDWLISPRCFCIMPEACFRHDASALAWGITKAAPLSRAGHAAPKI